MKTISEENQAKVSLRFLAQGIQKIILLTANKTHFLPNNNLCSHLVFHLTPFLIFLGIL